MLLLFRKKVAAIERKKLDIDNLDILCSLSVKFYSAVLPLPFGLGNGKVDFCGHELPSIGRRIERQYLQEKVFFRENGV